MDNNEFNRSNGNSNGDYSAPEPSTYYSEPVQTEAPRMKFDPETGRPLTQENPMEQASFQQDAYQQGNYQQNYNQQQAFQRQDPYLKDMYGQSAFDQHCQNEFQRNRNANMYAQSQKMNTNGFAIASLVLGIVSIVTCFCCGSFIAGPLAIIFGVLDINAKKNTDGEKGMSTAGIICGAIGLVLAIVLLVVGTVQSASDYNDIYEFFEEEFEKELHNGDDDYYYDYDFDIDEL